MPQKRAERLQIMLTLEEIKKVEEWRFNNRMPSRSAAVRALVNIGLTTEVKLDMSALSEGAISSSDVGILENESIETSKPAAGRDRSNVLVIENEYLVARGIKDVLESSEIRVIGPVSGWGEAKSYLGSTDIAVTVLGLPKDDKELSRIIGQLRDKGVPFLFFLAADPKECLPESLWSAPVVNRVSARETLLSAVRELIK